MSGTAGSIFAREIQVFHYGRDCPTLYPHIQAGGTFSGRLKPVFPLQVEGA